MFEFDIVNDEVKELRTVYHQTIKKVTDDYEKLAFNTAISQMMIFVNEVYKVQKISRDQARGFLKLLNPIAPHMTEEINEAILKQNEQLLYAEWPIYKEAYLVVDEIEFVVQVNGKLRAKFVDSREISQDELKEKALNHENVIKHLEGLTIRKVIVIKDKLVNIVAN